MSKKFVLGAICGAAIGAVAALLYAPKTGKELREELTDKSQDLKAVALDYIELASIKGEEMKHSALQKGEELKQTALQKSEEVSTALSEGVQELKSQISEKHAELKAQFKSTADEVDDVVEEVVSDVIDDKV